MRADVNAADVDGQTALFQASSHGFEKIAKALIAHGAKIEGVNRFGARPLHLAAKSGHSAVVQLLLAEGAIAAVPFDDKGTTALGLACFEGHTETVRVLMKKLGPNARATDWQTPLEVAAAQGNVEMVSTLLALGANPEVGQGELTPILWASVEGHPEAPDALDSFGKRSIDYARENSHPDVVKLLAQASAPRRDGSGR